MKYLNISMANFLSHTNTSYIFERAGLKLINGPNGVGKSSFISDSISWCLFGETIDGLKGDDVVNWKAKKNCVVSLEFEHGEKSIKVTRYRKDKTNKNDLIVKVGTEKIKKGTLALTQKYLSELIGIDYDLFKTTVVFAQGDNFNFIDETDKKQKEILGKIVKIHFDEMLKKVKAKYKVLEDSVSEIDSKVEKLDWMEKSSNLDEYQENSEKFEEEKEEELADIRNKIFAIEEKSPKVLNPTKLEEKKKSVALIIGRCEEEWRDLSNKETRVQSEINRVSRIIDSEETDFCDHCNQKVTKAHIKKIKSECVAKIKKMQPLVDGMREKMIKVDKTNTKAKSGLDKINEEIRKIASNKEMSAVLKREIKGLKEKEDQVLAKKNDWDTKIKEEKDKTKKIKLAKKKVGLERVKFSEDLPYYKFWVEGFGDKGIKSFVFDTICGQLTTRSNYYADILTGGDVSIVFDTQTKLKSGEIREKFEAMVIKDGLKTKYINFSGGERRRVSLAVDMALSDLMKDFYDSDFNIIVYDEQTSYMDKEGRECFMNLLREQSTEKNVFVVDHDPEFKGLFDNCITVEKTDGESRLIC